VAIALRAIGLDRCPPADVDGSGDVDLTDLERAGLTFLEGCS
jgi:hypothetical protein